MLCLAGAQAPTPSGVPKSLTPGMGPGGPQGDLATGTCVPPAPEHFAFYLVQTWETFNRGTGNSTAHPHMLSIWLSWILL